MVSVEKSGIPLRFRFSVQQGGVSLKTHTIRKHLGSTQIIALGFLAIIFIGTFLLMLPISSADGTSTSFLDSCFTSVSASCVTGLIVQDTATHWSTFGHVVILFLIQVGGLGFMTMAILMSLLMRRSITPKERMLLAMSYNVDSYDSIIVLVRRIATGTLAIEGIGAVILAFRFVPDFGWGNGIFKSIFHSVSAFCNAGFDIVGVGNPEITSLSYYMTDPLINLTLALLIIIGGIGFLVWSDLVNFAKGGRHLSVYSRIVLIITGCLLLVGTVFFAVFEWKNPATLGSVSSPFGKLLVSFFQSSTWRTAGFATMNNGDFTQNSQVLGVLLMFIGGASGSTAGGIKVGTFGIFIVTVFCVTVGKKQTVILGRNISENSFVRAASVICVQLVCLLAGVLIINAMTPENIMDVLYEATSAISTVGVTTGITGGLPAGAKVVLMFMMYFGRVGVLTITYALMNRQGAFSPNVRYPDAKMPVG